MADDFEFEVEGIRFRVKRVNRCRVIYVGRDPHCEPSDHQSFWVHHDDRYRVHYEPRAYVGLFVCSCRKCNHERPNWETLPDEFAASYCFQDYLKHRQYEDKERLAREARRAQRVLDQQMESAGSAALDICRRIAVEGYTEEIAYEIMELIQGLPEGE